MLLVAALLAVGASAPAGSAPPPPKAVVVTSERVTASLGEALAWYRQARVVMRSVDATGASVFGPNDTETARRLVEVAFDAATAEAALVPNQTATADAQAARSSEERDRLQAAVRSDEDAVTRAEGHLHRAPARKRADLEQEVAAARNRLELDRARLDFATNLASASSALATGESDLGHEIQTLRNGLPELRTTGAGGAAATPVRVEQPSGTWGLLRRVVALQQSRGSLSDLTTATTTLGRDIDSEINGVRTELRPTVDRLRQLSQDPTANGTSLADGEREFHDELGRAKLLAAALVPLRQESALVHRYAQDLQGWERVVDRQTVQLLEGVGIQLAGVAIAFAVILLFGLLWRLAVVRYVEDGYRRRLLLTARTAVVAVAIGLVVVFHFTTELAALVTALGFAAAGIAFALQNVILAVAGYFSIVAPDGIRVGDRVSLQGPFGYVHGEVVDIGFLRIKLRELAGEPLQPTDRIVVFPNSVVFTGSFYKDPDTPNRR